MMVYVTFGGMVATTWVQIIKAGMLLAGGTLVMILAMSQFGFVLDHDRARHRGPQARRQADDPGQPAPIRSPRSRCRWA